ncbi:MAG: endonuclease V [Thermoplasmata archaeon]
MNIDLYEKFYSLVKQIPKGMVSTYGDLAIALGDIVASRAVGKMLSENPSPFEIPCHRVVMHDGSIGGFTHPEGLRKKIEILKMEGVEIENGKIKNFNKIRFNDFKTDYPLKKIRENEEILKKNLKLKDTYYEKLIAIDVSYTRRVAFISMVHLNKNFEILKIDSKMANINFPYIPTYLSYREGNAIISVLEEEGLLILDGQGIMHPRGIGLATYVGIEKNLPSLGIAKSHLVGTIINDSIFIENNQVGWKIGKYYISPGNLISLKSSKEIAKKILDSGAMLIAHKNATDLRNKYCSSNNCGPFT